jgi:hypothetical protein
MTKSKQIRAYKEANPTAKPKAIGEACGVTTTYVYQVLHNAKKKKKPVALATKMTPTEGQKIVREELDRLHAEIANLTILEEVNDEIIEQLNRDIIGYRAVISYLQGQIDGVTV